MGRRERERIERVKKGIEKPRAPQGIDKILEKAKRKVQRQGVFVPGVRKKKEKNGN